jgi:hypothetical protein
MEQIRHARIPVHLNAVLIGEKTVPKGCKVRNVSNQGLLLQCDADGRILTFNHGDHVDIHLLFHRPDGTKYQTITATVRHVDANGIGVEFCQPDAQLIKLIESYRIDDSQSIEATITHHRKAANTSRSASVVAIPTAAASATTGRREPPEELRGRRLYYLGLLALAIAVVIFTAGYLRTFDLVARVSELESIIRSQNGELSRVESRLLARSEAGAGGADQGETSVTPPGSVAGSEHDPGAPGAPQQAAVVPPGVTETTAATWEQKPDGATSVGLSNEGETTPVMPAEPAAMAGQGATSAYLGGYDAGKRGPWVINLLSSPNKSDADRFAEKARSKGIPVEQSTVTLRDREFFRVQLTGFMTEKLAMESAGPVKEKLGLQDVWIFRP